MSNTGAPLNLPKPTSTSNTGQDMIQMAASLQAINDFVKTMRADTDALMSVQNITWDSTDRVWHTKPSGFYYHGNIGVGYPSFYGMILHMVSPASTRYMAQVFVAGSGVLRIRAMNQSGAMGWMSIS